MAVMPAIESPYCSRRRVAFVARREVLPGTGDGAARRRLSALAPFVSWSLTTRTSRSSREASTLARVSRRAERGAEHSHAVRA